jgi:3-hydroxyisobutyrate dehydrogenase-like beta-hydroxyacid dehydrogenase
MKLGVLHPGEMGISIAASARNTLGAACWCSAGRSAATRKRAEQQHLLELASLQDFCDTCDLIIGVCPPHAAWEQAQAVIAAGFKGCYVDANAIAPDTVQGIGREMSAAGITFIDGGIIGLPAWQPRSTWLYLSGPAANEVADCFAQGPLETAVLGADIGPASALKMCFAAWNKGNTALLTAVLATAEANGVRAALEQQWDIYTPGFATQTGKRISSVARKAWRFTGEMQEIAATFAASGIPPEFFMGAAEVYARQSMFKDIATAPDIEQILNAVGKND